MTNKYRSLEHIILSMMRFEAVGTTDGGQFSGNQPVALKGQKMTVPQKQLSTGPQAISKSPKVPNQGDQQDTPTGMEVSRESGGKKKIKEDTDSTNVKLIKQGSGPATTTSMLNKGPLTQYTNPQNPSTLSNSAEPKSSLSFQTPDLSGKEDDSDVETPPKKKLGAGAQKPTTDNVTKKINPEQAEKTVNKILGTPGVKMSTPGTKMSTPSTGSGAGKAPQMLPKASNDNLQPAKVADAGDGRSTKAINTNAGNDVDPAKFNNQQQATPPVSPGSGAAGNSPKAAAPAMQNPTSPSVKKADVIGKEIGVDGQSKAQQVSAPPPFDPKNLPLSRAAAIVPGMREPHTQASVKSGAGLMNVSNDVSNLPPIKVTPDGATGEFSDKEKSGTGTKDQGQGANQPSVFDRLFGKETPAQRDQYNKDKDAKADKEKSGPKQQGNVNQENPSTKQTDKVAPNLDSKRATTDDIKKELDSENEKVKSGLDKREADKKKGVDVPLFGKSDETPEQSTKAGEKPGSKEGWQHAFDHFLGRLSPEQKKAYEEARIKMQPKDREEFDKKSLAISLLGGAAAGGIAGGFLARRAATGAAARAGAGAGLGEKALEGAGLISLIKHIVGKGASGAYGNRSGGGGGGGFITAPQGQISGTPTRRKGGMSEEVQNLDKVRRALSYVGRRDGDNKKKPTLGRQAAIKTNIIDESRYVAMMREAIKEKQKKDKDKEEVLEPGEHKTKIDVHPQIKKEPQDNIRQ